MFGVLKSVPDPRKKRGVRHRFAAILFVSVCAVVSGARSFAAIAEWAADAVDDTLHRHDGQSAVRAVCRLRAVPQRSAGEPEATALGRSSLLPLRRCGLAAAGGADSRRG